MEKLVKSNKDYNNKSLYWSRKTPSVMGDIRQRPELIKFIGTIKDKKVLDAGCGAGYFTKLLNKQGGSLYGCDISKKMIDIAVSDNETKRPISYHNYDMCNTKYKNNFFDFVVSVGAIFHLNQNEYIKFIKESNRILKKGGQLVFSIEHPFLFTKFSPTQNSKKIWAKHKALDSKDYDVSQKFEELYFKKDGEKFTSILWHHSLEFIINNILKNNFNIIEMNEVMIKKEDLISDYWGKDYGYPAFIQIKAIKK